MTRSKTIDSLEYILESIENPEMRSQIKRKIEDKIKKHINFGDYVIAETLKKLGCEKAQIVSFDGSDVRIKGDKGQYKYMWVHYSDITHKYVMKPYKLG